MAGSRHDQRRGDTRAVIRHDFEHLPVMRWLSTMGWATVLAFALLIATGCGRSPPVVEGTVTLDGMPVAAGAIMLIPANGKGPTAGGGITTGRFRIEAAEGPKQVRINYPQTDGTKMLDPGGSGQMIDRYVESVPARYNEHTELTFTVQPGRNAADFALEGSVLKSPHVSPK